MSDVQKSILKGFAIIAVLTLCTWGVGFQISKNSAPELPITTHLLNSIVWGKYLLLFSISGGGLSAYYFVGKLLDDDRNGKYVILGGIIGITIVISIYYFTWDLDFAESPKSSSRPCDGTEHSIGEVTLCIE